MPEIVIGWRQQLTTETRPWAVEMALEEDAGDVAATPTATLVDLLTGLSYPAGLLNNPSVAGTVITQSVTALQAGHNYRLVLTANMGGSKTTSTALLISCPF